jgi:hypothetical protein
MLVKTKSMYAALYDEKSPVNVEHFMSELFSRAESDPRANSLGPGSALFVFNQYLIDCASRRELLPWALLLDGIFDCEAQLTHDTLLSAEPIDSLGNEHITATLRVPSGRLVVSCLGELGKGSEPILHVKPGIYHASLTRNGKMESKHWAIDSEADYVPGGFPDWVIRLCRANGGIELPSQ